jgi:hypothetical protein
MTLFWVYTGILEYHTLPIFRFVEDVYSPETSMQTKQAARCHNSEDNVSTKNSNCPNTMIAKEIPIFNLPAEKRLAFIMLLAK